MLHLALRRKPFYLLSVLLLLCSLVTPAFADTYVDDPFIVTAPAAEEEEEKKEEVGILQDRLAELGYYSGSRSFVYDMETRSAVLNFCRDNGIDYSTSGVRRSVWDRIMDANANPAKGTAKYEDLAFGSSGTAVLDMQTRLKALNYYAGGLVLTPEKFDADTQTAVQRFCDTNGISYSGSGASAAVQQLIFSDGAVEYVPPTVEQSLSERLSEYMMRDAGVASATLPMFVVWILGALLIVLIAAAVLHFFVPGKRKAPVDVMLPPSSRPSALHADTGEKVSQEKLHGSSADRPINFRIEYQGQTRSERLQCSGTLSIGRGAGDLRLDSLDHRVSRSHCDLCYEGAVLMLSDHSRNGTLVNGSLIHNCKCRINSGDTLTIGAHIISVQL